MSKMIWLLYGGDTRQSAGVEGVYSTKAKAQEAEAVMREHGVFSYLLVTAEELDPPPLSLVGVEKGL